jgi:hypothetical protein
MADDYDTLPKPYLSNQKKYLSNFFTIGRIFTFCLSLSFIHSLMFFALSERQEKMTNNTFFLPTSSNAKTPK